MKIDSIIERAINETLNNVRLNEKEKQVHLAAKTEDPKASSTPDDQPKKLKPDHPNSQNAQRVSDSDGSDQKKLSNEPTVDDIAEKLNSIRSGKSLRDSMIKQRFERYIMDLSKDERIALFAFLKGLNEIITGTLEPDDAFEPRDPPAGLKIHKNKPIQSIKKKPTVLKKKDSNSKPSVEDNSPPVPIKPK